MSAERPPLVILDTNVLLATTDVSRRHHLAANGLGMHPAHAVANIGEILQVATMLTEGAGTTTRLLTLLSEVLISIESLDS